MALVSVNELLVLLGKREGQIIFQEQLTISSRTWMKDASWPSMRLETIS